MYKRQLVADATSDAAAVADADAIARVLLLFFLMSLQPNRRERRRLLLAASGYAAVFVTSVCEVFNQVRSFVFSAVCVLDVRSAWSLLHEYFAPIVAVRFPVPILAWFLL